MDLTRGVKKKKKNTRIVRQIKFFNEQKILCDTSSTSKYIHLRYLNGDVLFLSVSDQRNDSVRSFCG